jgi:hypothetical protein
VTVAIDPRARRAYGVPATALPTGAIVIANDGQALRVRGDGGLDELQLEGYPVPSIAADPCARARRRR